MKRCLTGAGMSLGLLLAAPPPAAADEVTEQLDAARAAYESGDFATAASELQFALGEIQGRLGEQYGAALPKAPAGWEAGEIESQNLGTVMGGGVGASRTFRKGEAEMTARILSDSPLVQMGLAMMSNPALIGANPGLKRVRVGSETAMVQWEKGGRSGQASMVLGGKVALMVEGSGLADPDPMVDLLRSWDLGPVRKLAGL